MTYFGLNAIDFAPAADLWYDREEREISFKELKQNPWGLIIPLTWIALCLVMIVLFNHCHCLFDCCTCCSGRLPKKCSRVCCVHEHHREDNGDVPMDDKSLILHHESIYQSFVLVTDFKHHYRSVIETMILRHEGYTLCQKSFFLWISNIKNDHIWYTNIYFISFCFHLFFVFLLSDHVQC